MQDELKQEPECNDAINTFFNEKNRILYDNTDFDGKLKFSSDIQMPHISAPDANVMVMAQTQAQKEQQK